MLFPEICVGGCSCLTTRDKRIDSGVSPLFRCCTGAMSCSPCGHTSLVNLFQYGCRDARSLCLFCNGFVCGGFVKFHLLTKFFNLLTYPQLSRRIRHVFHCL